MKIYLFDTETGIYLGEDFADEGDRPGDYRLPEGATTIAPPETTNGIPRFDPARQRWEVLLSLTGRSPDCVVDLREMRQGRATYELI